MQKLPLLEGIPATTNTLKLQNLTRQLSKKPFGAVPAAMKGVQSIRKYFLPTADDKN